MQRSSTGVCAIDILLNQKSRQMDSRFDPHMTRRYLIEPRFRGRAFARGGL